MMVDLSFMMNRKQSFHLFDFFTLGHLLYWYKHWQKIALG
ncbi:hypothetical protein AsAng_0041390 [Aureispira anguillae]|uniref:Uncharacterized protein n=1 Tax=Aureispira anguillae TaxID=2864201 RepID=A0A915YI27_9BACT|nr:hypothetical protein AsAng_0041390 [Aureispira anguillae]